MDRVSETVDTTEPLETLLSTVGNDRWAWLRAGTAVAAVGWGANQFAPMLLVYRSQLGVSSATVEAMFGMYALGLIPGLLVCGPLSDRLGRRPIMLAALLASVLATVMIIAGSAVTGLLFAGRLVAGIASGAAFSSGAAWIKELSVAGGAGSGPRRVTVTMTAGFGAGPLVAGLVAQCALSPMGSPMGSPMVLPYLPHLLLLAAAIALVLRTPETRIRGRRPETAGGRSLAELRSPRFRGVVLPLAPWVFGSASIGLAYLPGLVSGRLGATALAFTAVVTMLTALAGILVQPLARRIDVPGSVRLLAVSSSLVVGGVLVSALAASTSSVPVVVAAILALGAGYGSCQVYGLQEIQRLARAESLAGLTAVYQATSYLGLALPFPLAAAARLAPPWALLLGVAGLAAVTLGWTVHRARATAP